MYYDRLPFFAIGPISFGHRATNNVAICDESMGMKIRNGKCGILSCDADSYLDENFTKCISKTNSMCTREYTLSSVSCAAGYGPNEDLFCRDNLHELCNNLPEQNI